MTSIDTAAPDLAAVKQRQQSAWASGDFAVVAARIVLVAEHLCDTADLQAGWRVLDVATGSGNAAIDGRLRRQRELGQQQAVDLVRRRAGGQRLLQRRRQRAGQVVDRAERPRDREVVAGAEQYARVGIEIGDEAGDEGGLADPGLAGHDDDATVTPRCRDPRLREHSQCPFPLQELHASTINAPSLVI